MGKNRVEKDEVNKNTSWGSLVLVIIVMIIGVLAYNHEAIGEKWTKVLEIVGAPFALGLGFFAYEKSSEAYVKYKEKYKEKEQA